MGRKKRNRHKHKKIFSIVKPDKKKTSRVVERMQLEREREAEEEKVFFEYCTAMDFKVPYMLTRWRNHFVDRSSFLTAARKWAREKEEGIEGAIVTDVSKGKTSYAVNQIKSGNVSSSGKELFNKNGYYDCDDRDDYKILTTGEKADMGDKPSIYRLQALADTYGINHDSYTSWEAVERAVERMALREKDYHNDGYSDQEFDDDYWKHYTRKERVESTETKKSWGNYFIKNKTLPLTPKIDAPTGKSVGILVSL